MDTDSIIPIYFQISKKIIDQIRRKKLKPGDRIPSENEIIRKYSVSNTTARKVLQEIEKHGYVKKIKGKGTYVKDISVDRSVTKVLSFTLNMLQEGLEPSTHVLGVKILDESYTKTLSGRNYTIPAPICHITRLRLANNVPMMYEDRYISLMFCPGIEKLDLSKSLYEIYKNEYALYINQIDQVLRAIIIDSQMARSFYLEGTLPGFMVEGAMFCGPEMLVELEESIYRGDKYQFRVPATS